MVKDYTEQYYLQVADRFKRFCENDFEYAKYYCDLRKRTESHWNELKICNVETESNDGIFVNSDLQVKVAVELGALQPDDVDVQIYFGKLNHDSKIVKGQSRSMECEGNKSKKFHYTGTISSPTSGLHGFTIRIVPRCSDQVNPFEWHLVHWQN